MSSVFETLAAHPLSPDDVNGSIAGMQEQRTLFTSWEVPKDVVDGLVPPELEIDTYNGSAFVTLVALHMHDLHIRAPVRFPTFWGYEDFEELNLRTYVKHGDKRGIHFLSVDTSNWTYSMISNVLFHLPCHHADMHLADAGGELSFESRRHDDGPGFSVRYAPPAGGEPAAPGSLEDFLCERYSFFAVEDDGDLVEGRIWHEPWMIAPATVDTVTTDIFSPVGLPDDLGAPVTSFYAAQTESVAWRPRRIT